MNRPRIRPSRRIVRSILVALGTAALLGGCVAYPAYPDYGYYGPGYGYAPAYVAVGGGWGWHGGGYWHH
jgi:hypothetical protein